jgi:predicted phage tail protein
LNAYGESEKSNVVSAMPCTLPSAPKNLTAIAGNRNVTLTWEPPADNGGAAVTNYTIYYGPSSGNYTHSITIENITHYTLSGLTNGITYFFAVSAINKAGESERSNEVSAIPCTVPSPPRNLTAAPGNANVSLNWEVPEDDGGMPITSYTIYYGTSPGNYTYNITVSNVTNYTIGDLTNGIRYYFAVSAINLVGESNKSNEVEAKPFTTPGAVQNLVANVSNSTVNLTWAEPADNGGSAITVYRIYRGLSETNFTKIAEVNTTNYVDKNLKNGVRY